MFRQATLSLVPLLPATPATPAVPAPSRPFRAGGLDAAQQSALRRALARGIFVLGQDGADPYGPERGHGAAARGLLQALARVEGLEVAITTRSPRVLQDLSLLAELDQRHAVRVDVPIAALDPEAVRRIEPGAAFEPEARLWTVSQLAAEGITTRVLVRPLLPGVNDREADLRDLFEAARKAGAADVLVETAPAKGSRWLDRLGGPGRPGGGRPVQGPGVLVRRLRLEHGFPRPSAGRG